MDHVRLGEVELAYQVVGSGAPVVLIHAGALADFFAPLQTPPALADHHLVIRYHRIGYGASSRPPGPVEITDQADHCRRLLAHLGIPAAHIVGHSSGGLIALQLARQAPQVVASLALLEPALTVPSSPILAQQVIAPMAQRYTAGDPAGAIEVFLRGVGGPDAPATIQRTLGADALPQAATDAATFFEVEAPAVGRWRFTQTDAATITQPVLAVLGEHSHQVSPVSDEAHELLLRWFPQAETYVLPAATHLLHLHNPTDLAQALAAFLRRHPLPLTIA
jgi:pimeloyl-ACP methyl ester carboxylesterase